ncbi:MAG TPA: calcium/sodium antiporter [Chromatiales bacterium]|nr:calcium/sodium antiporter [Chromatiales bacterium]
MWGYSVAVISGLVMLVWGADRVVLGVGVLARNHGISPMLIGLTLVGFATSLPEVVVSATAALEGVPNLAIGNALGSNIANVGLVIGVAALVRSLSIQSETLRRELPVMLAVSVIPVLLFSDGRLSRLDGVLLLTGLAAFVAWITLLGLRTRGRDPLEAEFAAEIPAGLGSGRAIAWITVGLAAVLGGSNALVWGAANGARSLGISELVIGLTVVAVGTSLPELAVSVASARKGEHGLALGNVIGSNAFNLLAVIGVAAVIHPAKLDPDAVTVHLPAMLAFTVALFFIAYNQSDTLRVSRPAGFMLLAAYLGYLGFLASTSL